MVENRCLVGCGFEVLRFSLFSFWSVCVFCTLLRLFTACFAVYVCSVSLCPPCSQRSHTL